MDAPGNSECMCSVPNVLCPVHPFIGKLGPPRITYQEPSSEYIRGYYDAIRDMVKIMERR